jgi:ribosomal protein L37AE/L43A
MKAIFCPKCNSSNLEDIGDGYYKCNSCGYKGSLGLNKEIFKS